MYHPTIHIPEPYSQEPLHQAVQSPQHLLCLHRLLQHAPRLLHVRDLHLQEEGEEDDRAVPLQPLPGQHVQGAGRATPWTGHGNTCHGQ